MNKIIFSLFMINFLLFELIVTTSRGNEIDEQDFFPDKRSFANQVENQREYIAVLDKRRYLARTKFEEHCEPKGKILERICPPLEQCLLTHNQNKQNSLREIFDQKEDAHQFLHSFYRKKRFLFVNSNDDYQEKSVNERRRKGLSSYEHYCESTDRLPRSCPSIDRCKCGDCNN